MISRPIWRDCLEKPGSRQWLGELWAQPSAFWGSSATWAPNLSGQVPLFVGCNPSTAAGDKDDATTRKIQGFARRWGCAGWGLVNLSDQRSTNPHSCPKWEPGHTDFLLQILPDWPGPVVCCWGDAARFALRKDLPAVIDSLAGIRYNQPLYCWGYTGRFQPRHPLMLSYKTPLQTFCWPGQETL